MAYGAIVALQDKAFVDGVRDLGSISRDGQASSYEVVRRLAERTGAQCFPIPTPVIAGSVEERRLLQTQRSFAVVRELAAQAAVAFVGDVLAGVDEVYLTIDLDVLPAAVAPGVSAPAALGVPPFVVQAVCDAVVASGKLVHLDVTELNPRLDVDQRTARVAARLIHRIITRHASTPRQQEA